MIELFLPNLKSVLARPPFLFKVWQMFDEYSFTPLFLLVHLTFSCNCNCKICFQRENDFYRSRNKFLSQNDFRLILESAKKGFLLKPLIHLFGGEPLLNSNFGDFLSLLKKEKFTSSLTTNGFFLKKEALTIVRSGVVQQINVSLDGPSQIHDKIRRLKNCFSHALEGIREIAYFKKKSGTKRPLININFAINEDNFEVIEEFTEIFLKEPIDSLSFGHLVFSCQEWKMLPKVNIRQLTGQLKKVRQKKLPFPLYFLPSIKDKDLKVYYFDFDYPFGKNCFMPWLGLGILPNLEVTPGGSMFACNQILGSLKETSLAKIWNGAKLRAFRRQIKRNGVPRICFRCCHRQFYG